MIMINQTGLATKCHAVTFQGDALRGVTRATCRFTRATMADEQPGYEAALDSLPSSILGSIAGLDMRKVQYVYPILCHSRADLAFVRSAT